MNRTAPVEQLLLSIISAEQTRSRPDREKLAAALMQLSELRGLSPEEQQAGFDIAPLASFTAIYHRADFEQALRFAEFALELADQVPNPSPVKLLQAYRTQAQARRALGGNPLPALLAGLRLGRRLLSGSSGEIPDSKTRTALHGNCIRLLFGLALHAVDRGRLRRADRILSLIRSTAHEEKDDILLDKLHGLLKIQLGESASGTAMLNRLLQNGNSQKRQQHTADILFVLLQTGCDRRLQQQLLLEFNSITPDKLPRPAYLKYTALQLQLSLDHEPDQTGKRLQVFLDTMHRLQMRFTSPEGVEGYLGRFEPLLEQTVNRCFENGDARTAFQAAAGSFWTFTLPDSTSENSCDPKKLPDKLTGFHLHEIRDLLNSNFPGNNTALLFFRAGDNLFRFHWNNADETPEICRLNFNSQDLGDYINGLHSFFYNPGKNGPLLERICQDLAKLLLEELPEQLRSATGLTVWCNDLFNMLPWHALFPGKTVRLQPGKLPPRPDQTAAANRLLAVIENGTTLPATHQEKKILLDLYPDINLIVPRTGDTQCKPQILRELQNHRIIYFGGHGYLDPHNPGNSGLLLYGSPGLPEEGALIRLSEIQQLPLGNVDLVFLNNCSSAAGKSYAGELHSSAAAAFLRAGAGNLIVTLAPLQDETALKFMNSFFAAMQQEPETGTEQLFNRITQKFLEQQVLLPYIFITARD